MRVLRFACDTLIFLASLVIIPIAIGMHMLFGIFDDEL